MVQFKTGEKMMDHFTRENDDLSLWKALAIKKNVFFFFSFCYHCEVNMYRGGCKSSCYQFLSILTYCARNSCRKVTYIKSVLRKLSYSF